MKSSKSLCKRKEPFEFDYQLVATELDTSAQHLNYISKEAMTDGVLFDNFDLLVREIESCAEIETFDDNTVMYEFNDEPVIIHNVLGEKVVIFDALITQKIELKLQAYNKEL